MTIARLAGAHRKNELLLEIPRTIDYARMRASLFFISSVAQGNRKSIELKLELPAGLAGITGTT